MTTNTWKLNNMLLNNEWVNQETKGEIKNYMKTNKNENTMAQNLCDSAKMDLRRKFIALQIYFKKQEKSQINNLILHIREL